MLALLFVFNTPRKAIHQRHTQNIFLCNNIAGSNIVGLLGLKITQYTMRDLLLL